MKKSVILISNSLDSLWTNIVADSLKSLASVTVVTDQKIAKSSLINAADLVLIDVTAIRLDITILLRLIHDQQPELPIIVVTTSPTWQRSRQAFLAGATDYIRKSFRPERIRAACTATWSEIELPE